MNREDFAVELTDGESPRTDSFVASLGLFPRSQIRRRSVRVFDSEGRELKASRRVRSGEILTVEWEDPPSSEIEPEKMDLEVLYEDESMAVINKEQGVVVHPAHGHYHGTLVQGLLYRYSELEKAFKGDRVRPGVVHRLDKDTSGIIVAAKNPESLEYLANQFRNRSVKKTYLAIVKGAFNHLEGEIDDAIGRDPRDRKKFAVGVRNAKEALSRYRVLDQSRGYSLVQVRILTGRTHQIRVHMKSIGHPVLGDPVYGRRDEILPEATLMLHSWKLAICPPGKDRKRFTAPVPERFYTAMEKLGLSLAG